MYYSDYNRPPEEREPIETIHYQVSDPEPPKKKKNAYYRQKTGQV